MNDSGEHQKAGAKGLAAGWTVILVTGAITAALALPLYQAVHFERTWRIPAQAELLHASGITEFYFSRSSKSLTIHRPEGDTFLYCWPNSSIGTCLDRLADRGIRNGDSLSIDYFTFKRADGLSVNIILAARQGRTEVLSYQDRVRDLDAVYSNRMPAALTATGLAIAALGFLTAGLVLLLGGFKRSPRRSPRL